ncbi:MAG: transglutaminase domain-containing protein [Acidimicrobiaceae bacterium]|nr:transglutaminase domain-containing protein [Acidimicrobiaceae bacterium]
MAARPRNTGRIGMTPRRAVALAVELATIVLSIIAALSLGRVFIDNTMLNDLIALALTSHAIAIVTRRAGFSMLPSALVSILGFLVMMNILLFPETAGSIIPTQDSLTLLRIDLRDAWTLFEEEPTPVEAARGFVVAGGAALWLIAFLADWAALRLRSSLEAIAPATSIFVFTSVLGAETDQVRHGAIYAAAVAAVLLAMRAARRVREEVWIASGTGNGVRTTLRVGTVATALALGIGVVAGPAFPNAGEGVLDPTEWDDGPQTRQVVSPLVEIGASLVNQSNFEMFSVRVDDPQAGQHYWRLMALTDFDGTTWKRKSNFAEDRGRVGSNIPDSTPRTTIRQTITTLSLANIYMPAAYEVSTVIDSSGIDLEYEQATGALVVTRESAEAAGRGFTYVIESAVPNYTPESLPANATAGLDAEFVTAHTSLPPVCDSDDEVTRCWPDWVTGEAERITASAATDYERVRLLQSFFVDSNSFAYDLNVASGHSINTIEDFLNVRRGYCEQFASTFAAMARSIGIPTRIAVGFTWGEFDAERGEYVVRGEHAHAWPELYFSGVGWIVMDPTPGRGPSHNADITGLAPAQLNFNDDPNNADGFEPSGATSIPDATSLDGLNGSLDEFDLSTPTTPPAAIIGDKTSGGINVGRILVGVFTVTLALAITIGIVPIIRFIRRRRRISRVAADPVGRGELAWDDACVALALLGVAPVPQETPIEFAHRSDRFRFALGPVWDLASAMTVLRYTNTNDLVSLALQAQDAARQIEIVCHHHAGRRRVAMAAINPRNLRWN